MILVSNFLSQNLQNSETSRFLNENLENFAKFIKKKNMNFHETKKLTHTVNSVLSFEDISIFEIISNLPRLVLCHVQEKTHLFATAQIL